MLMCYMKSYLSSQLLDQLQKTENDAIWDENSELLLWLLYIGGTFASAAFVRSRYVDLLRKNITTRFPVTCNSCSRTLEIMRKFIWSDIAFYSEASILWREILSTSY